MTRLLLRSLMLGCGLILFGLLANYVSPRGIQLTRNYFPTLSSVSTSQPQAQSVAPSSPSTQSAEAGSNQTVSASSLPPASETETNTASSVRWIDLQQAENLWQSPDREAGLILFLDARSPEQYAAGHIPGAKLFDHYHADQYLPHILPLCTLAQTIVVYCTGGQCEESEFAAATLIQVGVPIRKICIYRGGFTEWQKNGLPIETGPDTSSP